MPSFHDELSWVAKVLVVLLVEFVMCDVVIRQTFAVDGVEVILHGDETHTMRTTIAGSSQSLFPLFIIEQKVQLLMSFACMFPVLWDI